MTCRLFLLSMACTALLGVSVCRGMESAAERVGFVPAVPRDVRATERFLDFLDFHQAGLGLPELPRTAAPDGIDLKSVSDLDQIKGVWMDGGRELNLRGRGIRTVAKDFVVDLSTQPQFANLVRIDLSRNPDLKETPDELWHIGRLTVLRLDHTGISRWPGDVELSNIQELTVPERMLRGAR